MHSSDNINNYPGVYLAKEIERNDLFLDNIIRDDSSSLSSHSGAL